jgi:hypothetical protein
LLPTALAAGQTEKMAATSPLQAGARIHQYELIRELGRGGMGQVWAARDVKLGRRIAIKFLVDASASVGARFLSEARATAQCNHDNIVVIHEIGELEGMPYMVLEFLEGHTLRQVIRDGVLSPPRAIELALPIARALARAHDIGIVHRDLKPENVFVTTAGQVKVLDFGIAKAFGPSDGGARLHDNARMHATREGAVVGTLPYMSPEQLAAGDIDHRSDIWALGITMFEMLSGRHPLEPLTTATLYDNAMSTGPMPAIASVVPDLPPGLASLVDDCLRKRQHERIGATRDVVDRLEALLPGRRGARLAEGECPFPGLAAFQEADAERFFGREREIARTIARIREQPLLGVVGPSGAGKSSFVRAGVVPALKASGEDWEIITLRPGRNPIATLASIADTTVRADESLGGFTSVARRIVDEPGHLGTLLRARANAMARRILVFVDQFEELYTLVPDLVARRTFTAALAGIADDAASPLRVVIAMRSDFLDRVSEDTRFTEELSRGLVVLSPLHGDALRDALKKPIEMVGHRFETTAMVDDMIATLEDTAGALPLLQFAAGKLWDARDREQRLLTVASYHAIGGIAGALAVHADEVVAALDPSAYQLTRKILRALVTPERTRMAVGLGELEALATADELQRTIDRLVAARLLVVHTSADDGRSLELVHESLIERWPTLRRWLDEDHEDAAFVAQLAAAAKQWDTRGRPVGLLWRGDAADEARRWYARSSRELARRDRAFLDAVFELARRGVRLRRTAIIAAFAVLAVIAGGASIALVSIREAEQKATDAAALATRNLVEMQEHERMRQAAEAERLAAERSKTTAEKQKAAAEEQRDAAEAKADKVVEDSREQLEQRNRKLESALRDAKTATKQAEQSSAELTRANVELRAARERDRAEIQRLNDEKKKLSTDLK